MKSLLTWFSYIYSQTWVKKVCFSPLVVVVVVVQLLLRMTTKLNDVKLRNLSIDMDGRDQVKELLEEYVGGWMQDKPMVLGDEKNVRE